MRTGMEYVMDKVEGVEAVVTSAEAEAEITELKSALSHVAMLAKCAQEATIEERKQHAAEIARLKSLIEEQNGAKK